jgi:hypothetical protein
MGPSPGDEPAAATSSRASEEDAGGDPACWARRVCAECGRLNEAERPLVCEACGANFPRF